MSKPKVLVLNGNTQDASSFYQSTGVFPYIDTAEFTYSTNVDWPTILAHDIIFLPRPYTPNLVSVCEYVKTCKKKLIISLDDNHFAIPEHNPSYKELGTPQALECHRACIRLADSVWCTTEHLAQAVLKEVPEAKVIVIPNAANDYLFDLTPSYHVRNKTILVRGGGSPSRDIETYKDAILQIAKDYPEYKWALMGYWAPWLLEAISDERLLLFPYGDLMKYFETLMELKPEIMIVPLEDTEFNNSKSNIAWIEGTLAGATVYNSYVGEFKNTYAYTFLHDTDQTVRWFPFVARDHLIMNHLSLERLPKLSEINELRKDEIERLAAKPEKFLITPTENKIATNKEFFNHCLTHGHLQDNEAYQDLHSQALGQLHALLDFKTVVEFGCGPGYTLELLNDGNIQAFGMELNPYFIEYFRNRNPHLTDYIAECDFIKDPIELDESADLGISIEVFEHIDLHPSGWDWFIEKLSWQFKHFYFSSTPFRDKPSWDLFWGHNNIRTTTSWIKLFEKNGWELVCRPKFITGWDILFISKNVNSSKPTKATKTPNL